MNPYHYQRVIGPGLDLSGLNLGLAAAHAGGPPPANWPAAFDPRTAAQLAAAAQRQQQQQQQQSRQQQHPAGAVQVAAAAAAAAWANNGAGRGQVPGAAGNSVLLRY